jgi:hypothetical protein
MVRDRPARVPGREIITPVPDPGAVSKAERIVLTYDAKARFSDLPGVSATEA